MLTTIRRIDATTENIICYFGNVLIMEFTHTIEGNMHTFKRNRFQLYNYPLYLSEHIAMTERIFANSYTAADVQLNYQAIARDYKRLIMEARRAIDMGL